MRKYLICLEVDDGAHTLKYSVGTFEGVFGVGANSMGFIFISGGKSSSGKALGGNTGYAYNTMS